MKHLGVLVRIGVCFMGGMGLLGAQTQIDLRTQGKSVDFSSASSTKPYKTGTNLPGTCSVGEAFFLTSAPAGKNLHTCTSINVWTIQEAGTVTNSTGALSSGQPVIGNGFGDVRTGTKTGTGTEFVMSESPVIVTPSIGSFVNAGHHHRDAAGGGQLGVDAVVSTGKQGNGTKFQMFGGGAFANGDCARFDAAGNIVSAGGACGGGESTAQNVGSGAFFWFKQKAASAFQFKSFSAGARMAITEANDVVVFDVNEGAMNLANVGGTLPAAKLGSGVDAAKIGTGTVNNTRFGYLASVTSDLQTQLDSKSAANHNHTLTGDVGGNLNATAVTALRNRLLSTTAPANGQALVWNATANQWEPQTVSGGVAGVSAFNSRSGAVVPATGDYSFAQISGSVANAQIGTGIDAAKIGTGAVNNAQFGYLAGVTSALQTQLDGKASSTHGHTAAGDVGGNLNATVVTALRNRLLSTAAPSNGQALVWNASSNVWEPQTVAAGVAGVSSFHSRTGSVTPAAGDYSFEQISGSVTNAQMGTGIDAAKIGSGTVNNTRFEYLSGVTSDLQTQLNGKAALTHTHNLSGDVGGSSGATVVTAIRNRFVSTMNPSNGQVLTWNAPSQQWEPQTVAAGAAGVSSFNSRTGAVAPANGDYSFAQISGTVANSQLPAAGGDVNGTLASASVVALRSRAISTAAPASGQALIWNGTTNQWEPQTVSGGTAGVSSFNSRTGVVTPANGDYSFAQISGTVASSQLPAAGGDLSGTLASASVMALRNRTVSPAVPSNGQVLAWSSANNQWEPQNQAGSGTNATQIQGRNVTADAPSDGQSLVWNAATNTWRPASVAGGGGGEGASMATDLGDLRVARTGATTLTVGSGCSVSKPCNVRFGSLVYSVTAVSTITVSSGAGTAFIYMNQAGNLIVGHTGLGVACAGASCSAQAGITGFPVNTIPLWTWTATGGSWDMAGGADRRSMLSAKIVTAGSGITIAETASQTTVSVDAAVIGVRVGVPANATSACSAGNWAVDSNHYYICVATNTWRRAALGSW
jgi:hypothetical protein